MKHIFFKKFISALLCVAIVMSHLPIMSQATLATTTSSTSIADPKTLSDWEDWFSADSNRYSGGIFLDKSVYTASEAKSDDYFEDIQSSLSFGSDNFGNENFMVALSALGSNSEVLGYTHTPTDTMIVLDASTSMGTGGANTSSIDDMVKGANEAIKRLLNLNNHNRIGVVIYNGTASVLLPLDRYKTTSENGYLLEYVRTGNQNRIYIASNVTDGNNNPVNRSYIAQAQGTYTQGGIFAAAQQFLSANPIIEEGKIQSGTYRIPIMVLMSDGEPSYRTKTNTDLTINKYTNATNANCDNSNFREDDVTAFSTMLTAAWAEEQISSHYNNDARFYTLGYNLSANHEYAHNVLDPMNPNNNLANRFVSYAEQYLDMETGKTKTFKDEKNNNAFKVTRASDDERVTSLDYVDRYWQAGSESRLAEAFDAIVDEIVIQSRYYSTLVTSSNYHQDGFISFTDEIGSYMEVKDIKGLYIGDGKLVTGGMFAEFATTGKVDDYDNTNYDEENLKGFESEILSAIEERFGISSSDASLLINSAKDNKFISYTSRDEFSNYIAWYADENNKYIAPYTDSATHSQSGAKYIVRSYFYMGDVTQNHVETSMLYTLVRVREDIETGRQIVDMNIPAALLPMVTYTISVNGDELTQENISGISCEQKNPISLLYEVGLDSQLTPINIEEKMEGQDFRKDENGVYTFYTNRWRDNAGHIFTIPKQNEVDSHVFNHGIMNTTVTQFIPSLENERFYYTENIQVLDSNYNVYTGSKPEGDGYYVEYRWIEENENGVTLKTAYNPISSSILDIEDAIIQIEGKDGWFIKKGTPQFYFGEEVHGEQAHSHKTENITSTLGWSDYPQVVHHESEGHTGYHMLNYLGNNGLVRISPAQGIKLTKTVSTTVDEAPDSFEFEVKLNGTNIVGSYSLYIEHTDSTFENKTVNVGEDGIIDLTLKAGDVAYITNLPVGTKYTVTEKYNSYYTASSTNASGIVKENTLSDVNFVNSPKGYGSLLVEKDVTYQFDTISEELMNKEFNITVTFEGIAKELGEIKAPEGAQTEDNGITYTIKLKDGSDALFTNIPEGVKYKVIENNIPTGFTLETEEEKLAGIINKNIQSQALLVNDYKPENVSPNITISGEKTLNVPDGSERVWDSEIDKYQVALQEVTFGGQEAVAVGNPVVVDIVKAENNDDYVIDMSNIKYTNVGTYSYVVYEVDPGAENRVESVSYDTSIAMFSVKVIDNASGKLIVESVVVYENTATLEGDSDKGWTINKDFTNNYMADTISFPVIKKVYNEDKITEEINGYSGGIMIGLYESVTAENPVYSTLTDENGNANFILTVKQSDYLSKKYLYLREVIPLGDSQVTGMTYNTEFKYVIGIDWSDETAEEPTVEYYEYNENTTNGVGDQIADITLKPLTIINTYDKDLESNSLTFGGKKTVNGGELRRNDSFRFALYQTDATFNLNNESAKLLDTKTVNSNNENGEYVFDDVSFDSVGTKYLVIIEEKGNVGGIVYDTTKYHITVDVSRELKNNKIVLEAKTINIYEVGVGNVEADKLDFDNTYRINDSESVVIKGNKILTGRNLVEGEFTFGLFEKGSNEPLYTTTNNYDGSFDFPAITYDIVDRETFEETTYEYIVKEIIPDEEDLKGIKYTTEQYEVVITLKDDGNGGISKNITVNDENVTKVNVEFENTYFATETTLTLGGTKYLENKDMGEFTINLYETDEDFAIGGSNDLVKSAIADVSNGGQYSFNLKYPLSERGYHYYVMEEFVPEDTKGVQYDVTKYYITVDVMDNGHGEMEANIISIVCPYYSGNFTATELNFTNKYFAEPDEYIISGTKFLENNDLEADMFEFCLSDREGEIVRVKNNADGSFAFPAQTFETAGLHTFYVSEIKGGNVEKGVTYDNAVYAIIIPVYDDGEGNLKVDEENIAIKRRVGHMAEDATEIVFNNIYKASSSDEIYIDGIKYLEGKSLEEGEFEFELYEADQNFSKGNIIETTDNEADGTFKFNNPLTYNEEGKYYYVVSEKNLGAERITYDDTVYGVIVTVTDNKEGKFVVSKTEIVIIDENSIENVEDIAFNNVFTPKPEDVTVDVVINKTVINKGSEKIGPKGFEFILENTETNETMNKKSDENGNAVFTLNFSEDDIGNTYTYKVKEKNTNIKNVQYDDTTYTIEITVGLNNNNVLTTEITVNDNEVKNPILEFENVFDFTPDPIGPEPEQPDKLEPDLKLELIEPDIPKTGDDSQIFDYFIILFVSVCGMIISTFYSRKNK